MTEENRINDQIMVHKKGFKHHRFSFGPYYFFFVRLYLYNLS